MRRRSSVPGCSRTMRHAPAPPPTSPTSSSMASGIGIPSDDVTFNEIDEQAKCVTLIRTRSTLPLDDDVDDDYWAANYDDLPFCKGFGRASQAWRGCPTFWARCARSVSRLSRRLVARRDQAFRRSGVRLAAIRAPSRAARACRPRLHRSRGRPAGLAPAASRGRLSKRTVGVLLTPRQREVLSLVAEGLTNREIARRLDISPGTVRIHLEHAYPKLGALPHGGGLADPQLASHRVMAWCVCVSKM